MIKQFPFSKSFVITLLRTPERYEAFCANAHRVGIRAEILPYGAVDGAEVLGYANTSAGAYGCWASHRMLLEEAMHNDWESYLVFEDDCIFVSSFAHHWQRAAEYIPADWKQLYLGGELLYKNIHPPIRYNRHWNVPFNVNRTHAFAVHRRGYDDLYGVLRQIDKEHPSHVDWALGKWHLTSPGGVYIMNNVLCGQSAGKSVINGGNFGVRYWK